MCFKAERGYKTHRAMVREGINTGGERDCSQQSGQQLAGSPRDGSLSELKESSDAGQVTAVTE